MSMEAASSPATVGRLDQLRLGKQIVRSEAAALSRLADDLDADFCDAARILRDCPGSVIVSGMGKAGLVGRKISATLASTGTRAHFQNASRRRCGRVVVDIARQRSGQERATRQQGTRRVKRTTKLLEEQAVVPDETS